MKIFRICRWLTWQIPETKVGWERLLIEKLRNFLNFVIYVFKYVIFVELVYNYWQMNSFKAFVCVYVRVRVCVLVCLCLCVCVRVNGYIDLIKFGLRFKRFETFGNYYYAVFGFFYFLNSHDDFFYWHCSHCSILLLVGHSSSKFFIHFLGLFFRTCPAMFSNSSSPSMVLATIDFNFIDFYCLAVKICARDVIWSVFRSVARLTSLKKWLLNSLNEL